MTTAQELYMNLTPHVLAAILAGCASAPPPPKETMMVWPPPPLPGRTGALVEP